jgi:hypothetical protein
VVYVDQSAKQSDADPRVSWRVIAIDTQTDRRLELSSNGSEPDPYVPELQTQDGFVFWTQAEADRSALEMLWRPDWEQPRVVVRHTEMTPGGASIDDDHLVYLGPAATGATRRTAGGDCWSVPLAGGTPQPLTRTALAMSCEAADGDLVWTTHIDPGTEEQPSDGILDDPYELWAQAGDHVPRLLERGYFPLTRPAVADGYVAWRTYEQRLVVQSIADPTRQAQAPGASVRQVLAGDRTLVYLTRTRNADTANVLPLPPA